MSDIYPLYADEHRRLAIGIAKKVAWEEAKAKLRTVAALSGSYPSTDREKYERFKMIRDHVESFIKDFEGLGYNEA